MSGTHEHSSSATRCCHKRFFRSEAPPTAHPRYPDETRRQDDRRCRPSASCPTSQGRPVWQCHSPPPHLRQSTLAKPNPATNPTPLSAETSAATQTHLTGRQTAL